MSNSTEKPHRAESATLNRLFKEEFQIQQGEKRTIPSTPPPGCLGGAPPSGGPEGEQQRSNQREALWECSR